MKDVYFSVVPGVLTNLTCVPKKWFILEVIIN